MRVIAALQLCFLLLLLPYIEPWCYSINCQDRRNVITNNYHTKQFLSFSSPGKQSTVIGKKNKNSYISSSLILNNSAGNFNDTVESLSAAPLVLSALLILFAAQSLINQMLYGDEGLSAYLRDGTGYNKSGFKMKKKKKWGSKENKKKAPMAWLKLPQLDFVDVAGQEEMIQITEEKVAVVSAEDEKLLLEQLETIRIEINQKVSIGDIKEAELLKIKLERLMEENGINYKS